MRSFLAAVILALVLGGGSYFLLERDFQQASEAAFSTPGVRL